MPKGVTMAERMRLLGKEPTEEEREFFKAWEGFNQRVGFPEAVSVTDQREIELMWIFWRAGRSFERGERING